MATELAGLRAHGRTHQADVLGRRHISPEGLTKAALAWRIGYAIQHRPFANAYIARILGVHPRVVPRLVKENLHRFSTDELVSLARALDTAGAYAERRRQRRDEVSARTRHPVST